MLIQLLPLFVFAWMIVMSAFAFVFYGVDKARAKRRAHRIPEGALLSLGFFGGAAGALLAMQVFRHKTRHWYFYAVNMVGLLWQVLLALFLLSK